MILHPLQPKQMILQSQRNPAQRIFSRFGSRDNAQHFLFLESGVNAIKGRIEVFRQPIGTARFDAYLRRAAEGSDLDREEMFAAIRETIAVFHYVNDGTASRHVDATATDIRNELVTVERNTVGAAGLAAHWEQAYPYYFAQVSEFARNWVNGRLADIRQRFQSPSAPFRDSVLEEVSRLEDQVADMYYPFEER